MYVDRKYRNNLASDLETFEIKIKETDLLISVSKGSVDDEIKNRILQYTFSLRNDLESYISQDTKFRVTLVPHLVRPDAPVIARQMAKWANMVGVGPMAAVAGGFAEFVGKFVKRYSDEIIVENGGDVYLSSSKVRIIGIFAGRSPFSNKVGLKLSPQKMPLGVCTSSGNVGPSLSFGKADAAVVLAKSTFLADAAATAVGNRVQTWEDFEEAIGFARNIKGVEGVLLIKDDKMAAWGEIELVSLKTT
jgi:ApbE superfamily uncharacterized protein (UPF0280 family)